MNKLWQTIPSHRSWTARLFPCEFFNFGKKFEQKDLSPSDFCNQTKTRPEFQDQDLNPTSADRKHQSLSPVRRTTNVKPRTLTQTLLIRNTKACFWCAGQQVSRPGLEPKLC